MRITWRTLAGLVPVALFSLAIGLVLVEVAVRILGLAPGLPTLSHVVADPHLPFRMAPRTVAWVKTPEFSMQWATNDRGFRDTDHGLVPGPGVFRILALGDSFTFGSGAAADETYLARLGRRLGARSGAHPPVEILNFGVPRYFPAAERRLLEREGVAYRPQIVLLEFVPNDVIDTAKGLDALVVSPEGYLRRPLPAGGRLVELGFLHSHAARLVLNRLLVQGRGPRMADVYRDDGPLEEAWRRTEAELARIRDVAERHGARLVLVHLPQAELDPYPGRRLRAWADAEHVEFVDTRPALVAAASDGGEPLYWQRDGHCTPRGYAVIGDRIADALVHRGLVP